MKLVVQIQDEWEPNPVCFFVTKAQDICLHLEKTCIYPKIFGGKILGQTEVMTPVRSHRGQIWSYFFKTLTNAFLLT